jgi:hypothetical protein
MLTTSTLLDQWTPVALGVDALAAYSYDDVTNARPGVDIQSLPVSLVPALPGVLPLLLGLFPPRIGEEDRDGENLGLPGPGSDVLTLDLGLQARPLRLIC